MLDAGCCRICCRHGGYVPKNTMRASWCDGKGYTSMRWLCHHFPLALPPFFAKNALGRDVVLILQVLDNLVCHVGGPAHVEDGVLGVVLVADCTRQRNIVDAVCPCNHRHFGRGV